MEGKVYHGSRIPDLKELSPKESTQVGSYLYATTNPLVALYFTHSKDSLHLYFGTKMVDEKKMFYIVERIPGTLENYRKPSSLYVLDGKDFDYFKKDSFGNNEVRTDKKQTIAKEIKIEDTLEELKKYEERGQLKIHTYDNKPDFVPNDDSDMLRRGFRLYLMGGKKEDRLQYFLSIYPQFKDELQTVLNNTEDLSIEDSHKYINSLYDKDGYLNREKLEEGKSKSR